MSGDWRQVQNEELHVSYRDCTAAQCSCPPLRDIAPHRWIIGARSFGTARRFLVQRSKVNFVISIPHQIA